MYGYYFVWDWNIPGTYLCIYLLFQREIMMKLVCNHVSSKLKAIHLNAYELSLSVMDYHISSLILPCFSLAPAPFIFPKKLSLYFKTSPIRTICSSEDQLSLFSSLLKILNFLYRFEPYLIHEHQSALISIRITGPGAHS